MSQDRGAFLSSDLSGLKVRVGCERCKLTRQFDGNGLIDRVGRNEPLPGLLTRIAVGLGCDLNIADPERRALRDALRIPDRVGLEGAAVERPPGMFCAGDLFQGISLIRRAQVHPWPRPTILSRHYLGDCLESALALDCKDG